MSVEAVTPLPGTSRVITATEVVPEAFSMHVPAAPCTYWSTGGHIVSNGLCRCGKTFAVVEIPLKPGETLHRA